MAPVARSAPRSSPRWGAWLPWLPVKLLILIVLPFAALARLSVGLYLVRAVPTWLALACGATAAVAILTWYGARISRKLTGRHRFRLVATRLVAPVVLFYCGYTLLYISSVNAKTQDIKQYYTAVHPLLRLSLSTALLFDRELVVTDTDRTADDYDRMGLARYENSLHFKQSDGYAHAVDLRTMRRAEWRNGVVQLYFKMMGFRTLRHVGTADHLHVSLPLP